MNITMLTIGSTGDVRPYILLGKELQKRGHQITVAAFSSFSRAVLDSGLSFFPLSGNAESFIGSVLSPGTDAVTYLPKVFRNLRSVVPDLLRDLEESCKDADAMVCNFFGSVYYSIAEKLNIPCIQTHFFPMDQTSSVPISAVRNQHLGPILNKATYRLGYYAIGSVEKYILSGWRRDNGITDRKASFRPVYCAGDHPVPVIYAISPSVFPRPSEWGPSIHMTGFWFDTSPVRWNPPESLERFLSDGEPPVYIGFGSMRSGDMNKVLSMLLRSLHSAGLRAVICGSLRTNHVRSGRTVYFYDFVPHDWLFPRVSAVVHHGGAGTTSAGLRWGRPTWILPFAGDQPFWGNLIYRIGCGPKPIPRGNLSVNKVTKGLINLTVRPEYKKNAAKIAALLEKEKGTESAADLIEKFIREW